MAFRSPRTAPARQAMKPAGSVRFPNRRLLHSKMRIGKRYCSRSALCRARAFSAPRPANTPERTTETILKFVLGLCSRLDVGPCMHETVLPMFQFSFAHRANFSLQVGVFRVLVDMLSHSIHELLRILPAEHRWAVPSEELFARNFLRHWSTNGTRSVLSPYSYTSPEFYANRTGRYL